MIAVVDYDAGNLHSAMKALAAVGGAPQATADPKAIAAADAVVVPGVGAFCDCVDKLRARGVEEALRAFLASGRPLLGICIGLQVLFTWGEEGRGGAGLGVVPGRVARIAAPGLKVPHMGWNALHFHRSSPLFAGVAEGAYVYFVHSYHALPADPADLVATCDYGGPVTAAVQRGNCFGVQFHPEKSGAVGLRILRNFVALAADRAA
jgi:glutamine amidotransferase